MLIKSIKLENIRSYTNQSINFDDGIVVLSGDIGSGKSTVLLAVEFALFGINESGEGLLRKGADEGSVELKFQINNQEHLIKRFLKRKSEGIRQTNGYIVTNDTKKDLTPIELKQTIISLLGYPQESLTKKSLIYRYTTYTPQDEMKHILYEDDDERIGIIRKIFGIDKYSRIIENSTVLERHLREAKKELLGKISDLDNKKSELRKIADEKNELLLKESEISKKLNIAKITLDESKKKVFILENELKRIHELKREKAMIESSIKHKEEQLEMLKRDISRSEQEISALKINPEKVEELKKKIKTNIREELLELEKQQLILQKQIGELETIKKHSEKLKKQVSELEDCPLCLQKVEHSHKEKITNSEHSKILEAEKKLSEVNSSIFEIKKKLVEKNNELHESNNAEKELSILKMQMNNIVEKEKHIAERKSFMMNLNQELAELKDKNNKIILANFDEKEKEYENARRDFEKTLQLEKEIDMEKAKITANIKNNEKNELNLKNEIENKEKSRLKINAISNTENWLQNNFTKMISIMEKSVLSSIHSKFNDTFMSMFSTLIEDERISSRIDESFMPKIEQNKYETEFENLSGGEKTSVSLAYRLALHKALNEISSNIQTKGLLLLDEPTDGFSSEQIDRLKDLFDSLKTDQAIIVSHENKIESLADHVIRIAKNSHESSVLG